MPFESVSASNAERVGGRAVGHVAARFVLAGAERQPFRLDGQVGQDAVAGERAERGVVFARTRGRRQRGESALRQRIGQRGIVRVLVDVQLGRADVHADVEAPVVVSLRGGGAEGEGGCDGQAKHAIHCELQLSGRTWHHHILPGSVARAAVNTDRRISHICRTPPKKKPGHGARLRLRPARGGATTATSSRPARRGPTALRRTGTWRRLPRLRCSGCPPCPASSWT